MRARRGSLSLCCTVGSLAQPLDQAFDLVDVLLRRRSWIAWLAEVTRRIEVTSPQPRQAPWPPVVA